MNQEKELDLEQQTRGYKKLLNYVEQITKTDYFKQAIKDLREQYKIPKNGFKIEYEISEINGKKIKTIWGNSPKNWTYHNDNEKGQEINNKLMELCKKLHLHFFDYYEVFEQHLFYNFSPNTTMGHTLSYNLCRLEDVVDEKREYKMEREGGDVYEGSFEEADDIAYPLAIRFSPYASQRDIIDYIKKMYPLIKEYQDSLVDKNVKLGKVKTKNKDIQKRNDFIYENKNKSLKEIRGLLAYKNTFLDDGHIAKIISLEKQKRKEV
jgi:hypothetical protein